MGNIPTYNWPQHLKVDTILSTRKCRPFRGRAFSSQHGDIDVHINKHVSVLLNCSCTTYESWMSQHSTTIKHDNEVRLASYIHSHQPWWQRDYGCYESSQYLHLVLFTQVIIYWGLYLLAQLPVTAIPITILVLYLMSFCSFQSFCIILLPSVSLQSLSCSSCLF